MDSNAYPKFSKTAVRSRPSLSDPAYVGWLHIDDHYEHHNASRGALGFKSVEEVKQAIAALQELLPAIDRLGDLVRE